MYRERCTPSEILEQLLPLDAAGSPRRSVGPARVQVALAPTPPPGRTRHAPGLHSTDDAGQAELFRPHSAPVVISPRGVLQIRRLDRTVGVRCGRALGALQLKARKPTEEELQAATLAEAEEPTAGEESDEDDGILFPAGVGEAVQAEVPCDSQVPLLRHWRLSPAEPDRSRPALQNTIRRLQQERSQLESLTLCGFNLSKPSSMQVLIPTVGARKALSALTIERCRLSDAACVPLGALIGKYAGKDMFAPMLQSISVAYNQITQRGLATLCHALADTVGITAVDFHGNALGDEGAVHLAKLISVQPRLKNVDISCCQITDKGVEELARVIPDARGLRSLVLDGNNMSAVSGVRLLEALKRNRTLTELRYRNTRAAMQRSKVAENIVADALQRNKAIFERAAKQPLAHVASSAGLLSGAGLGPRAPSSLRAMETWFRCKEAAHTQRQMNTSFRGPRARVTGSEAAPTGRRVAEIRPFSGGNNPTKSSRATRLARRQAVQRKERTHSRQTTTQFTSVLSLPQSASFGGLIRTESMGSDASTVH